MSNKLAIAALLALGYPDFPPRPSQATGYLYPPLKGATKGKHIKKHNPAGTKLQRQAAKGVLTIRHVGGLYSDIFRDLQQQKNLARRASPC